MKTVQPQVPDEAIQARRLTRPAEVFFIAHLAKIVGDMTGLMQGDDEFDYFIPIPSSRLHEISLDVADLELTVVKRFGFSISALPIPMAG